MAKCKNAKCRDGKYTGGKRFAAAKRAVRSPVAPQQPSGRAPYHFTGEFSAMWRQLFSGGAPIIVVPVVAQVPTTIHATIQTSGDTPGNSVARAPSALAPG